MNKKKGENRSLESPIRYNKRYANLNKYTKKQTKNIRGGYKGTSLGVGIGEIEDTIRRI